MENLPYRTSYADDFLVTDSISTTDAMVNRYNEKPTFRKILMDATLGKNENINTIKNMMDIDIDMTPDPFTKYFVERVNTLMQSQFKWDKDVIDKTSYELNMLLQDNLHNFNKTDLFIYVTDEPIEFLKMHVLVNKNYIVLSVL